MSPAALSLRPLDISQLRAAVELDRLCLNGWWDEKGYRDELERDSSDLLGLSPHPYPPPTDAAAPPLLGLGCQWTILDEAHIILLMVHPQYRGQGLGQMLLLGLLTAALGRGALSATLEVRASNQLARTLYAKFGFQVVGHRRRYYQRPDEDALVLWCRGLQRPDFSRQLQNWQRQSQARVAQAGWQCLLPVPHPGVELRPSGVESPP